jgi:serine/threonine-protein kinase
MLAGIARRQGRTGEMIAGFQQGTLLDPRSAFALDQLGLAYQAMRRFAEADRAFARAEEVAGDPADERVTHASSTVAWKGDLAPLRAALTALEPGTDAYASNAFSFFELQWRSRDYAAAIQTVLKSEDTDWGDQGNIALPRLLYVAWAYQAAGDKAHAAENYQAIQTAVRAGLQQQPDRAELHLALAFADAGLGARDDAMSEGRRAAELLPVSRDALSGSAIEVYIAKLCIRIGEDTCAFDRLRSALNELSGTLISAALLRLDPTWDPIRNDPRFAALLTLGETPLESKSAQQ